MSNDTMSNNNNAQPRFTPTQLELISSCPFWGPWEVVSANPDRVRIDFHWKYGHEPRIQQWEIVPTARGFTARTLDGRKEWPDMPFGCWPSLSSHSQSWKRGWVTCAEKGAWDRAQARHSQSDDREYRTYGWRGRMD